MPKSPRSEASVEGSHISAGGVRQWPDTMAEKAVGEKVRQVELENRQLRRQLESAQRKAVEQQANLLANPNPNLLALALALALTLTCCWLGLGAAG